MVVRLHQARDRDVARQAYAKGREAVIAERRGGPQARNPYLPLATHYHAFEQGVKDEREGVFMQRLGQDRLSPEQQQP
jgi:hypothetical protein